MKYIKLICILFLVAALAACADPQPEDPTATPSSDGITFSAGSGVYAEEFELTITAEKNAVIYYTTDGSDPREKGTEYTGPISVRDRSSDANGISAVDPLLFDAANSRWSGSGKCYVYRLPTPEDADVDKCSTIKAAAQYPDGTWSDVTSATYFIGSMEDHIQGIAESCEAAGTTLAVISITMDEEDLFDYETGIYVKGKVFDDHLQQLLQYGKKDDYSDARNLEANYTQRGREWERNAHIDFFESDGSTTTLVLSQDCGIRIQGNYSRSDYQKSFRLYARSEYGDNNFRYAVFGEDLKNDAGEVMDKFKTLILRNGGNCAFTTKYSDTFWTGLVANMNVDILTSRPAVVYLNGEYWGLYVLQEDFSDDYFEDTHGVNKDDVVLYKGDAETYAIGYKLDLGDIPEGEEVDYYFSDLLEFFDTHEDLQSDADYEEFIKLVDPDSAMDYYAVELWINNKWDWPGKNWSMWRTTTVDESNPYADGRWRFCLYDVEFGGVSGASDAYTNTIKEDNYKTWGMLDMSTGNPSVLVFTYLMTNETWREAFYQRISSLGDTYFLYERAMTRLDLLKDTYTPLYDQFFTRFPGTGSADNSNYGGYASYQCIADFLSRREDYIQKMIDWCEDYFNK